MFSRYSHSIGTANKREMVLLKSRPCAWGKCAFCDYIRDNSTNEHDSYLLNREVLDMVTGEFGALEVINSASVFELDRDTLAYIKKVVDEKNIKLLYFESYYHYRKRLDEIRGFFGVPIIFKCGIETFDNDFRTKVLNKGFTIESPEEVASYFDSVCLLVGIKGQTREQIASDIDTLLKYFKYGCVNVFCNNSTPIKADPELIKWFDTTYGDKLRSMDNIDYLYNNTDFGVGEI